MHVCIVENQQAGGGVFDARPSDLGIRDCPTRGEGGRLEVEVELSWVPPQVRAQGYQAPVGVVASLGVTVVM